ncbi:MAG: ATP-dependent helicase, partial [Candidatus Riflebacteria bacterium]|nr:ATP-dependent helicase [Candidatus Riflebacteria bacterium]
QQEVSTFIGILKSNHITPEDFEDAIKNTENLGVKTKNRCSELLNIYKLYEKERIKDNYLDYRDLIALTIQVLRNPKIAEIYRKRFKVILVDEFQDTDPAQFLLLSLLKGENTDIKTAVIGDPRQSIYRFRGADPSMMTPQGLFRTKYKATQFSLSQNYRSAKSIVKAATMLNWSDKLPTDGELNPNSKEEGFIKYFKVKNEVEEARIVGRQIANYLIYENNGKKYQPSDVAILVRNNYQIDLLAESLQTLHIPYQIAEDMKFFKAEEVITLVSLLKIAGSENDETKESALQTAFLSSAFGLNPLWTQAIISEISNNKSKISNIINLIEEDRFDELPETDESNKNKAKEFVNIVRIMESKCNDEVSEVINTAITSVLQLLENASDTTSRNILHLRNLIADYSEVFIHSFKRKALISDLLPELQEYINYYALNIELKEEKIENAVRIMTVHQSKGLEFPITVISGLCEGQFPVNLRENILLGSSAIEKLKKYFNSKNREINFFNPYPNSDEEQLEEERRLFFVGITRAKEGLIMTVPMRLGTDPTTPAPFFYEMGLKATELEKDDKILTLSEFRTAITGLSQDELIKLEPTLQEVEKKIPANYAIHGIRPRIFNKAVHDSVELPKDFCFSATSLKNYLDCPRKFFFKNLLGIDNPLENNSNHFIVGNAYHRVLEELHKPGSIWELSKEPTDEDLLELFEKYAKPMLEVIPFFERHKDSNNIKNALILYRDAVYKNEQLPSRQTKGVEKPFSFELDGSKIKGRFDRIALIDKES